MLIVRIKANNISFGCIEAETLTKKKIVLIVYDSINKVYMSFVPMKNELVFCLYLHQNVYIGIRRIKEEHLLLRKLNWIPNDILMDYFPLFY